MSGSAAPRARGANTNRFARALTAERNERSHNETRVSTDWQVAQHDSRSNERHEDAAAAKGHSW